MLGAAAARGSCWVGRDVRQELRGRRACYAEDWRDGWSCGLSILAPSVYIFCASVLPALAFGQQLTSHTGGQLTVVHVLVSTALGGLVQSLVGGQPLLINGVAEPMVLIYSFMYDFLSQRPDAPPFLAWAAWVCVWTAALLLLLALANTGRHIAAATPLSGDLFGLLTSILFMQQAIKGLISEFQVQPGLTPDDSGSSSYKNGSSSRDLPLSPSIGPFLSSPPSSPPSDVLNGLWALLLAWGLLLTSLLLHSARTWGLLWPVSRRFLSDYGAPLMVLVWSAASYILASELPGGLPRCVLTPNTWQVTASWTVAADMAQVPGQYIAMALVPAVIITALFWFDHGISSLMAQQPRFRLSRPPAYSWDLLLLAVMTAACGLLGLPPVNGVLPQAPMHTETLVTLRGELLRRQGARRPGGSSCKQDAAPADAVLLVLVDPDPSVATVPEQQLGPRAGSLCRLEPGGSSQRSVVPPAGPEVEDEAGSWTEGALTADACCQGLGQAAAAAAQVELQPRGPQQSAPAADPCPCSLHEVRVADMELPGSPDLQPPGSAAQGGQLQRRRPGSHGQEGGQCVRLHVHLQADAGAQAYSGGMLATGTETETAVPSGPAPEPGSGPSCSSASAGAHEQRVSNLIQSLLVAGCLAATPGLQLLPTAVLWGYFAFMALTSLAGNDMWERMLLLMGESERRREYLQRLSGGAGGSGATAVSERFLACYTLLQLGYLLGVMALVTWAGVAGVAFPLPVLALMPLRTLMLPRLLGPAAAAQLQVLDPHS